MKEFDRIKKVVLEYHGGFDNATDSQIMRVWNSLDETTQQKYLKKEFNSEPDRSGKPTNSD